MVHVRWNFEDYYIDNPLIVDKKEKGENVYSPPFFVRVEMNLAVERLLNHFFQISVSLS